MAVRASESPSKSIKSRRLEKWLYCVLVMRSARTSPFWKKLAEPVESVESVKPAESTGLAELAEPERESSYERQCHFLEGGVTVTGKGLSKKEKKSIRKELAPDKKKLLKEIRGEDPKPRAKPRRKKEPVRYRWCFDVHIKGLVRRSRVLEGAALRAFQAQFLQRFRAPRPTGCTAFEALWRAELPRSAFCLFLNDARTSYDVGAAGTREA